MHRDFEFWLENTYKIAGGKQMDRRSRQSRISNVRNVEEYEGNLDEHYRRDKMASLLRRFEYSRDEEARHVAPRHRVPFEAGADKYNGTATLKSAINLYRKFCDAR